MNKKISSKSPDKSKEFASKRLMELCERFESCSVPICPLDLLQDVRDRLPGEPRCQRSKAKRIRIAQGSELPRKGRTEAEWAAEKRWQGMTEEQKRTARERLNRQ